MSLQVRSMRGSVALACLVAVAALSGCGSIPENGGGVRVACEELVKQQLKAPGTADFGGVEYDPPPAGEGDGTWTATGYVDAENGFGANIRTNWTCTVDVSDEGETYSNGSATLSE